MPHSKLLDTWVINESKEKNFVLQKIQEFVEHFAFEEIVHVRWSWEILVYEDSYSYKKKTKKNGDRERERKRERRAFFRPPGTTAVAKNRHKK